MPAICKIFLDKRERQLLPTTCKQIEQYDAFVLAEVPQETLSELSQRFLIEEISDQYQVGLGSELRKPSISHDKGSETIKNAYSANGLKPGKHHFFLQFIGPVKDEWLKAVSEMGIEVREPNGNFTYIIRADEPQSQQLANLPFVRWIGHIPHYDRVSAAAKASLTGESVESSPIVPRTQKLNNVYVLSFFGIEDAQAAREELHDLGFKVLTTDKNTNYLTVKSLATESTQLKARLRGLENVHGLKSVEEKVIRRTTNDVAAIIMRAPDAVSLTGVMPDKWSGEGEIVGICDTGLDTGTQSKLHPDFKGRVLKMLSYRISSAYDDDITNPRSDDGPADYDSGHGTHVAGSVLGDGSSSKGLPGLKGLVRGLAHKANCVFQAIEQEMNWQDPDNETEYGRFILSGIPSDIKKLFNDAYTEGVRVHSNSWGGGDPGKYDSQCAQLDKFIWEHKDFCVLFAAGNDGADLDADGHVDLGSVTSPGTAKNCITVGASENERTNFNHSYGEFWPGDYPVDPISSNKLADNKDDVAAFSSRGPTEDGRTKPDVVAPGTYILSTRSRVIPGNNWGYGKFAPSKLYMFDSGTSMATPLTAGAVAVIRQFLRQEHGLISPSAALLKAVLILGAERLNIPGFQNDHFDNHQGFGRVNLAAIISKAKATNSLMVIDSKDGLKTGELSQHEITLSSAGNNLKIVLAYSDFPGNKLVNNLNLIVQLPDGSTIVGNDSNKLTKKLDANNNVEVVTIKSAMSGKYSISVVASNVPSGPQHYALALSGDFA